MNSPLADEQQVYRQRLLNVARACRESPNPGAFDMGQFGMCETPGCAFGHYAHRRDLQELFQLSTTKDGVELRKGGRGVWYRDQFVLNHFGITYEESWTLFSSQGGCGGATTALAAAAFIETFCEQKWPARATTPNWKAIAAKQTIPEGPIRSPEYAS